MPDLSGKVALVTGGASGIGAATMRRLVADGARVFGTDIDAEGGAALCAEVGANFAVQDVADEARWAEVVSEVVAAFGRLDILVNNAGTVSSRSIGEVDIAAWNRVLNVNLTGTMLGCRAAARKMCCVDLKPAPMTICPSRLIWRSWSRACRPIDGSSST